MEVNSDSFHPQEDLTSCKVMVFVVKQFHRQGRALVLHTFELSGNLVVTLAMYTSNACRFTKEFGSHGIELPELSPVDACPTNYSNTHYNNQTKCSCSYILASTLHW